MWHATHSRHSVRLHTKKYNRFVIEMLNINNISDYVMVQITAISKT